MALCKCKMCGGTLRIDRKNNIATCMYCGSVSSLMGMGDSLYIQFQDMLEGMTDKKDTTEHLQDGFWVEAEEEVLTRDDGENINIQYMAKFKGDMCRVYVAREHVLFAFPKEKASFAGKYVDTVGKLTFPNEDMEKELRRYLPDVVMETKLADGGALIAVKKEKNVYPLCLFGTMLDRHVAWMVSRMENLCCLLEYNHMVLNGLTLQNLFVNPEDHQLYLYGGWWFAGIQGEKYTGASVDALKGMHDKVKSRQLCDVTTDLESIRQNASRLLGYERREDVDQDRLTPKPFIDFIQESSESSADKDFKLWDHVLTKSYGERKYVPLKVTKEDVYAQE